MKIQEKGLQNGNTNVTVNRQNPPVSGRSRQIPTRISPPFREKTLCQTLTPDGLAMRFVKKPKKYIREYYFVRGGTIVEKIGLCYTTSHKDALKKASGNQK